MSRNHNNLGSHGRITKAADASMERLSTGSVTLSDVARLAGVGTTTVSRALNHPEQVAPKTLEKVNQAIALTGYVPNLIAGALASRKSHLVAAIIPSISNSVYAETIRYFSRTLRNSGYQVMLGETDYQEDQEESLVRTILSRKPDGLFFIGTNHTPVCKKLIMTANIPVVETWDMTHTPLDMVVGFSHEQIGRAVAEYLLKKGYRKFGSIWASDNRAQQRRNGFIETLKANGIDDSPSYVVPVPTTFLQGREGLKYLLGSGFTEGAVACSSDTISQGVLAEAQNRGFKIPEQLAVIGFGDQAYAAHTNPSLSTVYFDRKAIGEKAAEILLKRIEGKEPKSTIIDVGYSIIERETT
ncbi:MAG: LacI family DNA-binding transcriptional regulator [Desulfuromonadales bacterium]